MYFSIQMGKEFEKLGIKTFFYDLRDEKNSFEQLEKFIEKGTTVCVSFNFNGCSGEEFLSEEGQINYFEKRGIPFINIVVDHPFYYHKFLPYLPADYVQCSIDKEHEDYIKRFFPEIKVGPFLPLAGTELDSGKMPGWDDRKTEVVFTANYNPPDNYEHLITRNGPEYEKFYRDILRDFIDHPSKELTSTIEKHIRDNFEEADEEGWWDEDVQAAAPDRALAVFAAGENLPLSLPADAEFTLDFSMTGALYPNFALKFLGSTKKDGRIAVSVCKPFEESAEPVVILRCEGDLLPACPASVPDFRNQGVDGCHNAFSFNEITLAEFRSKVTSPMVRGLLSFIAEAPARACQSLLDDLTDLNILGFILEQ